MQRATCVVCGKRAVGRCSCPCRRLLCQRTECQLEEWDKRTTRHEARPVGDLYARFRNVPSSKELDNVVVLPTGTTLFHGTCVEFSFEKMGRYSWFSSNPNPPLNMIFARIMYDATKNRPRVYEMETTRQLKLFRVHEKPPQTEDEAQASIGMITSLLPTSNVYKNIDGLIHSVRVTGRGEDELVIFDEPVKVMNVVRMYPFDLAWTLLHYGTAMATWDLRDPSDRRPDPKMREIVDAANVRAREAGFFLHVCECEDRVLVYSLMRQFINDQNALNAVYAYAKYGRSDPASHCVIAIDLNTSKKFDPMIGTKLLDAKRYKPIEIARKRALAIGTWRCGQFFCRELDAQYDSVYSNHNNMVFGIGHLTTAGGIAERAKETIASCVAENLIGYVTQSVVDSFFSPAIVRQAMIVAPLHTMADFATNRVRVISKINIQPAVNLAHHVQPESGRPVSEKLEFPFYRIEACKRIAEPTVTKIFIVPDKCQWMSALLVDWYPPEHYHQQIGDMGVLVQTAARALAAGLPMSQKFPTLSHESARMAMRELETIRVHSLFKEPLGSRFVIDVLSVLPDAVPLLVAACEKGVIDLSDLKLPFVWHNQYGMNTFRWMGAALVETLSEQRVRRDDINPRRFLAKLCALDVEFGACVVVLHHMARAIRVTDDSLSILTTRFVNKQSADAIFRLYQQQESLLSLDELAASVEFHNIPGLKTPVSGFRTPIAMLEAALEKRSTEPEAPTIDRFELRYGPTMTALVNDLETSGQRPEAFLLLILALVETGGLKDMLVCAGDDVSTIIKIWILVLSCFRRGFREKGRVVDAPDENSAARELLRMFLYLGTGRAFADAFCIVISCQVAATHELLEEVIEEIATSDAIPDLIEHTCDIFELDVVAKLPAISKSDSVRELVFDETLYRQLGRTYNLVDVITLRFSKRLSDMVAKRRASRPKRTKKCRDDDV